MSERIVESRTPVDPYLDDPYAEPAATKPETTGRRVTPFMAIVAVLVLVAIILFAAVVAWGVYRSQQGTVKAGDIAPTFTLALYSTEHIPYTSPGMAMDGSGETIKLTDFRGDKVVVLNFWQTNCPPCHTEAPMLVEVYKDYRDRGVVMIGINVKDPDKVAFEYMAQYGITYPNGLDRGDQIQDKYRTTGQPETFIIDRNGRILKHFVGPPSENQLRREIEKALETS